MRPIATVQASDFALEVAAIARLDRLIDSEVGARLDEGWKGFGGGKTIETSSMDLILIGNAAWCRDTRKRAKMDISRHIS